MASRPTVGSGGQVVVGIPLRPARRYPLPSSVPHLNPQERAARGKAARTEAPRSSHAVYEPAAHRPDPITLLEQQAETRVAELVPVRHGRMLVSPFAFYRGGALIMASDLAATPRSGLTVQCCGDAHLSNFGAYASRERRLVFDINDFDETLPGPWEWDVKRLAVSMLIAARHNEFSNRDQQRIVLATVAQYRASMRQFAAMRTLDVWYAHTEVDTLARQVQGRLTTVGRRNLKRNIAKAHSRDSMQAFTRFTRVADGTRRIISDPPLIVPISDFDDVARDDLIGRLHRILRSYRNSLAHDRRVLLEQFNLVDFARKVVGVGSVGTDAWIALFIGRDSGDPLFLQVKEAQPSVLEAFAGASVYRNAGQRVVTGQRTTQASSDIFLGWMTVKRTISGVSRDYYVRQLRDWKGSAVPELMRVPGMTEYGKLCGATLARAHARSGDRIAIAAYLGSAPVFDRALLRFSEAYAQQNTQDYDALVNAVASGRVRALPDV
jgi:uncharacterized protein (DUF2252 family)